MAPEKAIEQQVKRLSFFSIGDTNPVSGVFQAGRNHLIINSPEVIGNKKQLSLQSITLNWEGLNYWLPQNLRVEASDDLLLWKPIEIESLPYRFTESGITDESRELRLKTPVKQRYIRLSEMSDFMSLINSLKSITGTYRLVTRPSDLYCRTVTLAPTGKDHQYQYDLPPSASLRHWHFEHTSTGRLFKGVWSARELQQSPNGTGEVWSVRRKFLQYAVGAGEEVIESVPVRVAFYDNAQAWRFEFDPRISGDVVPRLKIAWAPMEVLFVAEGKGPFEIRYGSDEQGRRAQFDLDDLLSQGEPERVELLGMNESLNIEEKKLSKAQIYLISGLLLMILLTVLSIVQQAKQKENISV